MRLRLGVHGRTSRPDAGQGVEAFHRAQAGGPIVAAAAVELKSNQFSVRLVAIKCTVVTIRVERRHVDNFEKNL
jgi:hypothetical protein